MALKISLAPLLGQPQVELRGENQAREWAQAELDFWVPLESIRTASPDPAFLRWDTLGADLKSVLAYLDEQPENWEDLVVTHATKAALGLQLLSSDPRASFLAQLKQGGESDRIVGATMLAFIDLPRLITFFGHRQWMPELVQAMGHRAAFGVAPKLEKAADLGRAFEAVEIRINEAMEAHEGSLAEAERLRSSLKKKADKLIEDSGNDLNGALDRFDEELKALRKKLEQELALRAPTKYWAEKAARHLTEATEYRRWFVGLLAGGFVAVAAITVFFLLPILRALPADAAAAPLWPLVLFSVLIAVWAWPLRLTSKLYLSHRHLSEDASEREIITRTFLALDETMELTPDDRQLLLSAIFRSSTGGLVKDDGGLSVLDLASARMFVK